MIEENDWWPNESDVDRIADDYVISNKQYLAENIKDARDVWHYRSKLPTQRLCTLRQFARAARIFEEAHIALKDDSIRRRVMFAAAATVKGDPAYADLHDDVADVFDDASEALAKIITLVDAGMTPRAPGPPRLFPRIRAAQLLFGYWTSLPRLDSEQLLGRIVVPAVRNRSPAWYDGSHAALFVSACINTFTDVSEDKVGTWDLTNTPELLDDFAPTGEQSQDED